jgi:hypothetical protein
MDALPLDPKFVHLRIAIAKLISAIGRTAAR